tara:strand:+ start:4336 stop:4866 length:531 start_codon:yes stop_codon:yes gene_type:complete
MSNYLNPATGRWPLTPSDIKAENPDTSYPKGCTAFDGYISIADPVEPAYDPMTQRLVLLPPGKWDIEQGLRMITTKDSATDIETTEEKLVDISSTWVPSVDGEYSQTYRVDPMSEQEIADNITNKTAQENQAADAPILAELAANDLKIVRALAEGDTVRIDAHKVSQAALRAKLTK